MLNIRRLFLAVAGVALFVLFAGLLTGRPDLWQPAAVTCAIAAAIGVGAIPALASYQFTVWIVATVVAGMIFPEEILRGTGIDMTNVFHHGHDGGRA